MLDHVGMPFELIANGGANEVGSIGVEALLDHKVDLAEVNVAEIDRNLFAVWGFWAELMYILSHFTIPMPSA
jgi:hypothetical protein